MALPPFSKRFVQQIVLHAFLSLHLLEALILLIEFLLSGHQAGVHVTILRKPLLEARTAHAMLTAQIRDRHPAFCLL